MIAIRDATLNDAKRLLEIYDYYVTNTAITFEYDTPSLEEFSGRIASITRKYPYLVLEEDGIVYGYAYASEFKERKAYDRSCELSIYIDRNARKKGYGKMLYNALEERLKSIGVLNMYVCIGSPAEPDEYLDNNSEQFHEHLGFVKVGEYHLCGCKFDRWYNMITMEKMIGDHR